MQNINNVEEILSKAQEMQGQFQKMQEAFAQKQISAIAGIKDDKEALFVEATINGMREVKKLVIGRGAKEKSAEELADLVMGAVNSATHKLNEEMQKEVQTIYKNTGAPATGGEGK